MYPGYCSRTASAVITVVPDPNKPMVVSAPLARFTRYRVDCVAPVGCSAATARPFSPPAMSKPPSSANVVPVLNEPIVTSAPLIDV
jgi:hypothetical protein